MTPAERVVVEAAVRWAADHDHGRNSSTALLSAVDALLIERNGPALELVEITWGQVVEGDQIYRSRNGGPILSNSTGGLWMEVTRSGPLESSPRMRINVKGIGRAIQPLAEAEVTVRRGATGKAVDVFASVLWSGQNIPEAPGSIEPESEES